MARPVLAVRRRGPRVLPQVPFGKGSGYHIGKECKGYLNDWMLFTDLVLDYFPERAAELPLLQAFLERQVRFDAPYDTLPQPSAERLEKLRTLWKYCHRKSRQI